MTTGTTSAASLITRVLTLANEVHSIAKSRGQSDLASTLAEEGRRWKDRTTTIVVAGAQKRGKSRMVNALVDRPDLLPVDADIATHTYLAVRQGPALSVSVRRREDGQIREFAIDPREIGDYASALGDPAKRRDVVGVEITVDHPLLQGVRLVDTPGVDSLTVGHRHTTMAMLQEADALLFTLSAQDQPVLRHELEFLAEAAQRIPAVAFVLAKVEDSTSWQALLAEDQRRLATFVERYERARGDDEPGQIGSAATAETTPGDGFIGDDGPRRLLSAPWFPVSSKLAEAAGRRRAAGAIERAEALLARSGMRDVIGFIRLCADSRELTRCAKVLSMAILALRKLAVAENDRVMAATQSQETVRSRLDEVEVALRELSERGRDRRHFSAECRFLSREVSALVRARLDELRRPYERVIVTLSSRDKVERFLAELPDSVERSLEAGWSELVSEVQGRVAEKLTTFLASMGLDPIEVDLVAMRLPRTVRSRIKPREAAPDRKFDLLREGVPGVTIGASISGLLVGALGLATVGWVVGPVVAAGVIWRRHQYDQAGRDQAGMRQALNEVFAAAANEMTMELDRAITHWQGEAEYRVDAMLANQRRQTEARRAELTALTTRDHAARRDAATIARGHLEKLTALGERATALRAEVVRALRR